MKKKIAMMMMALSLTFGVVGVPQTVFAASGSTSVSVSSGRDRKSTRLNSSH